MTTSPHTFQIVLREIDSLKRETLLLNLSTHSHYLSFTDKLQNKIFTINAFYVPANEVNSIREKCLSGQQVQRILGPSSRNERGRAAIIPSLGESCPLFIYLGWMKTQTMREVLNGDSSAQQDLSNTTQVSHYPL